MATIEKVHFTNSTNNRPVLVTATASPGTNVHIVTTNASRYDEVWLYAHNTNATTNASLIVEFGSNTSADLIYAGIPARTGLYLIVPGIPLQGNSTPPMVRATSNIANSVTLSGWVNRIIP
jgi:hypothetical protein